MQYLLLMQRYWRVGVMALLALALAVQSVRHNRAVDKLEECKAARVADRLVAERQAKEQKETTARNVIVYRDRMANGGKVADRIEAAPLPGNCQTPDAVRSADL